MRAGISICVTPEDRGRLEAVVRDRNSPQKHVWRARIVLLTAEGAGTNAIVRETGKDKTCVWRWQERFATEGVDGLLRDKTRPSRIPPLGQEVIDRVVDLTTTEPPHEATHWTAAAMAAAVGISVSSVQRIWRAHGLAPHRMRRFKLSNDPDFVPKLRDIVGLYVDPPDHAVVLSLDEKSQIAASSAESSTSRPPSTASSQRPTTIPNRSSGPPTPTRSSPPSIAGAKRWTQSTSATTACSQIHPSNET